MFALFPNLLDQLKTIIATYDNLQSFIDDTTLDPPDPAAEMYSGKQESVFSLEFFTPKICREANEKIPHIRMWKNLIA